MGIFWTSFDELYPLLMIGDCFIDRVVEEVPRHGCSSEVLTFEVWLTIPILEWDE